MNLLPPGNRGPSLFVTSASPRTHWWCSRLLNDRTQRAALQVPTVPGERDAQMFLLRVLQDVVAAADMVHYEALPFEQPQNIFGFEGRNPLAHADSGNSTRTSFTGILSEGMGRWSLRRLSR